MKVSCIALRAASCAPGAATASDAFPILVVGT
jgi:hypothetical protein